MNISIIPDSELMTNSCVFLDSNMKRHNTEPAIPNKAAALSTWSSSSSFGSTAPEDRRADKVFDQIEDMLTNMMAGDQEQRRLHCRVLEGHLDNEEPKKVFTAVVIVTPPAPK